MNKDYLSGRQYRSYLILIAAAIVILSSSLHSFAFNNFPLNSEVAEAQSAASLSTTTTSNTSSLSLSDLYAKVQKVSGASF